MAANDALLAAIEALERLIEERDKETEQYRMQLSQMRGGAAVVVPPATTGPYTGMGIVAASKHYLLEHGPQHAPDLAKGLKAGGLRTRSHRLTPTVYATLTNASKGRNAQFTRTPEGKWDVTESVKEEAARGEHGRELVAHG